MWTPPITQPADGGPENVIPSISKLLSPVKAPSTATAYRSGSGNGDRRGAITEWAGRSGREELICAACVAIGTNHMGGGGGKGFQRMLN